MDGQPNFKAVYDGILERIKRLNEVVGPPAADVVLEQDLHSDGGQDASDPSPGGKTSERP